MRDAIRRRLGWALLASVAALGLCVAFVQPIFSVPDEDHHWAAGHARVERALGASDDCVPTLLANDDFHRRSADPPHHRLPIGGLRCETEWDVFGDLMTYPGILLSKLLVPRQTQSPQRQAEAIMLTRLLQGLIVLASLARMGVLAFRTRRPGALTVFAFALSPLLVQQAFGVSTDGAQLAFAVSLANVVLFFDVLSWMDVALLCLLGSASTAKPFMLTCIPPSLLAGYWFSRLREDPSASLKETASGLMTALRPRRKLDAQSAVLWSGIGVAVLTVLAATVFKDPDPGTRAAGPRPGVDGSAQTRLLLGSPAVLWKLLWTLPWSPFELRSYVGPLGWLDVPLPGSVFRAFARMLGATVFVEILLVYFEAKRAAPDLHWQQRARSALLPFLIGAGGPIANLFFVTAVLYVLWTPLGSPVADGVQTRYFLGSTIVMISVVFSAVGTVFPARPPGEEPSAMPRSQRVVQALSVLAVLAVVLQVVPYIAKVFVQLTARYG